MEIRRITISSTSGEPLKADRNGVMSLKSHAHKLWPLANWKLILTSTKAVCLNSLGKILIITLRLSENDGMQQCLHIVDSWPLLLSQSESKWHIHSRTDDISWSRLLWVSLVPVPCGCLFCFLFSPPPRFSKRDFSCRSLGCELWVSPCSPVSHQRKLLNPEIMAFKLRGPAMSILSRRSRIPKSSSLRSWMNRTGIDTIVKLFGSDGGN